MWDFTFTVNKLNKIFFYFFNYYFQNSKYMDIIHKYESS